MFIYFTTHLEPIPITQFREDLRHSIYEHPRGRTNSNSINGVTLIILIIR